MADEKKTEKRSNARAGDSGFRGSGSRFCCGGFQKMSGMMETFGCGDPERMSRMMENFGCGDSEKMSRWMEIFRGDMGGAFNPGEMMRGMRCGAPRKCDEQ